MNKTINKLLSKVFVTDRKSGPGLSKETIAEYNIARGKPTSGHICHAPFTNMYFNVHGDCAPCWLTFLDPDSYPQKSVRDIWFGERYQSLRRHLLDYDLRHKCNTCLKNLQGGNYTSVLARAYDINPVQDYPSMLELELENTCNLECVMCIGELSSAIRKNREKLPALKSPYDQAFVDQLEEFIPHLRELRFNGGEPFLINWVYRIFEKVEKLNPSLKIVVATNGTVVNYKVKEWLDKLNIHINFSLDSLTPEIYEGIRVNAHYDRVMENFRFFHEYTRTHRRTMCLMVNPMRNNWHEMPEFIRFVNKHNINIWFNTIQRPEELSIWALPYDELRRVYHTLSSVVYTPEERSSPISGYNISIYNNLVKVQIKNWLEEAEGRTAPVTGDHEGTSLPDNDNAKAIIEKNLSDYALGQFKDSIEQRSRRLTLLMQKIEKIQSELNERNGAVDFYAAIYQTPADVLYSRLEGRSVQDLVAEFESHFLRV
ncbi:MAG: radical SAM protein [Bacteroidetes bacterium]|nr:radical SAM protein [Bacteroidota bacterium]